MISDQKQTADTDAVRLAEQVKSKAEELLEPLSREMRIRGWDADYQTIMWEAVMTEAQYRWLKVKMA